MYCAELTPNDYYLFGNQKKCFKGREFENNTMNNVSFASVIFIFSCNINISEKVNITLEG